MEDRNWFDQFGDFAKKANDATYGAALRGFGLVNKAIGEVPTRIAEAFDPNDDESRGDKLLNEASSKYGFTPLLRDRVYNANPVFATTDLKPTAALKQGVMSAGQRHDDQLHRVSISQGAKDPAETLRHEGLHDIYDTFTDNQRTQFRELVKRANNDLQAKYAPADENGVSKAVAPSLSSFLRWRLNGYNNAPTDLSNIDGISPDIQNEIHSYIPEFFDTRQQDMPDYLRDYYANFYNTGGKPTGIEQQGMLRELVGKLWPNG